ncbi:Fur family transcriptional regulator [Desulfonatronovibrio hydrogenovorans]|uniref:Fur family transcriptional regulator n=1 Tax=Desulfonatronovibrio hydrogenovorans TaxID=53245 RepID=UPI00048D245C|nr:transcriptional repressor [Desulfonatronovibrio hydrogenovorans]
MRLTKQRKIILEKLKQTKSHPTAIEIYDRVRMDMPAISLGTVYRNLDILCRQGHIKKIDTCGDQKRFDGTPEDHLHVICSGCGRVRDIEAGLTIDPEQLTEIDSEFTITGIRLEILGLCPECQKLQSEELS